MSDNYVVIRLGSLGDVLLTTGVLGYWYETRGWRFHVVTRSGFSGIFKHHPAVREVLPVSPHQLTARGWWDFCRSLEKTHSSMELIDLHVNLRTAFLRHIWTAKVRSYPKLGLGRRIYAKTGLSAFKKRLIEKNVPQRYAAALSQGVPDQSVLTPRLYLKPGEVLDAEKRLAALGLGGKIICLHPYATHQAKAWPSEKWIQLIDLLEAKGLDWIVIGQNRPPFLASNPRDLTNQTSIRETGAIIRKCRTVITGDSGPMHLASAAGTPVIGLFGPTSREWGFYPSGPRDILIESNLSCRPCSLHGKAPGKCAAKCMHVLEPELVINALNKIKSSTLS